MKIPIGVMPKSLEGYWPNPGQYLVSWEYVALRMRDARNYWICTTSPDHSAHSRPVWGVWHDNELYFSGGMVKWYRNLQQNPKVAVHLDDSNAAVIFEGVAELYDSDEQAKALDDEYERKYNMRHGLPLWRLKAQRVYAWTSMQSMTKFELGQDHSGALERVK